MHIIKRKTIIDFYTNNPQSKEALEDWFCKTRAAT